MINKNIFINTLAFFFILLSYTAHAQIATPEDTVLTAFEEGAKILQDPLLQGDDKLAERRQKLWEYLKPFFHSEEMSRRALGLHWRKLNNQQRQEFITVFTEILKNFYLNKTNTYRGEKMNFVRKVEKDTRSKVQTELITSSGEKYLIDFSLINENNAWRVYDISIEGVSVINNYRSQFESILNRSSFEELMKKLKIKQNDTSAELNFTDENV